MLNSRVQHVVGNKNTKGTQNKTNKNPYWSCLISAMETAHYFRNWKTTEDMYILSISLYMYPSL